MALDMAEEVDVALPTVLKGVHWLVGPAAWAAAGRKKVRKGQSRVDEGDARGRAGQMGLTRRRVALVEG